MHCTCQKKALNKVESFSPAVCVDQTRGYYWKAYYEFYSSCFSSLSKPLGITVMLAIALKLL